MQTKHVLLFAVLLVGSTHGVEEMDVWMVPHAHCDVGWLTTLQTYYHKSVQYILDTVTQELYEDESLRFIWSEVKWLQLWWFDQSTETQDKFRTIVRRGQLEFVGGGWSQNDEVTTTWKDVIDNQAVGHEFLRAIGMMDECPQKGRCIRFGWQIDMFAGYSGVTPTLWALMGYDGMYGRWEGTELMAQQWQKEQAYQFIWESSPQIPNTDIWMHIMLHNYGDIVGLKEGNLCFDWDNDAGCAAVTKDNIDKYATLLQKFLLVRRPVYQGPLLAVWGSDFRFTQANYMFGNMSLIHKHYNENYSKYGIKIRYTTLAQYADHLHSSKLKWPVKKYPVDFEYGWPHSWTMNLTGNHSIQYQTGAPTSRAVYKQYCRSTARLHHYSEAFYGVAAATMKLPTTYKLFPAWDAVGIVQHHDSMPGTMSSKGSYDEWGSHDTKCKEGKCKKCEDTSCMTLEDYIRRLDIATHVSGTVLEDVATKLTGSPSRLSLSPNTYAIGDTVVIFNSLAQTVTRLMQVAIPTHFNHTAPLVLNTIGEKLNAQMDVSNSSVWFEVVLPPLGWATYFFVDTPNSNTRYPTVTRSTTTVSPETFDNSAGMSVLYDSHGFLTEIRTKTTSTKITQKPYLYHTPHGGAYCLVEIGEAEPVAQQPKTIWVVKGTLFNEMIQEWTWPKAGGSGDPMRRSTKVITGEAVIDINHHVPVLPPNTELISRFSTDLKTDGMLWNDDSGMRLYPRKFNVSLPISGNYHAMVANAVIKDESSSVSNKRELAIFSFHTKGIASLKDGELEYMLMRRIVDGTDDQGPWPLDETIPTDISMAMMIGTVDEVESQRLRTYISREYQPVVLYGYQKVTAPTYSGIEHSLPDGVHLLSFFLFDTLYPTKEGELQHNTIPHKGESQYIVVRFQNIQNTGNVKINVHSIFAKWTVTGCVEKTLSLQQDKAANHRFHWNPQTDLLNVQPVHASSCEDILLTPFDMRSFMLTVTPK